MADYKGIKGYKVAQIATDPTANEGQMWYNTTSNTLKYDTVGAAAWSSAALLNTHRPDCLDQGFGASPTATMAAGGWSAPVVTLNCEEYNGTSWTEGVNLTFSAYTRASADGTTTAGLIFGGNNQTGPVWATGETEEWNGTSWTELADMNTNRRMGGGAGTTTAGLSYGGYYTNGSLTAETEEWNGASWTVIPAGDMTITMRGFGSCGTQTAAVAVGGYPTRNTILLYDGATWATNPATMDNGRESNAAFGTTTSSICLGGTGAATKTEQFNGTAWTELSDSSIGKTDACSSGNSGSSGMGIGGSTSPYKYTEVWESTPVQVKTVTTS